MSDAGDLVLEHALGELFSGAPARDVAPRVRQALERGERGSLTREEVRSCERASAQEELVPVAPLARPGLPWIGLAAAAAVLLVTAAILWLAAGRTRAARAPELAEKPPADAGRGPAAGASLPVPASPGSGAALDPRSAASAEELERYDLLVAKILVDPKADAAPFPPAQPALVRYRDLARVSSELSALLELRPELWQRFEAKVRAGALLGPKGVAAALEFLHRDPSPASLALARELWLEHPEAFDELHIVGFAERGAFEFVREIGAMVAGYEPGVLRPPVLAAAHLAFRGDRSGTAILEAGLEDFELRSLERFLVAASALDASGDPGAWSRASSALREEVELRLRRSELMLAGDLALGLEFFARERDTLARNRLDLLGIRMLDHAERRRNEVQSEAEIRAVLDALPR